MRKCPYCSQSNDDIARRCMYCGRNLDMELARKLENQKANREAFWKNTRYAVVTLILVLGATGLVIWLAVFSPIGSRAKQAAAQTAQATDNCNPSQVSAAASRLIDLNDRWADIMTLAVRVDPEGLITQVDRLQKIRRDARAVPAPGCLLSAKASLIDGMDDHLEGLIILISQTAVDRVNQYLTSGNLKMNTFADEVDYIQQCAPDCQ